MAQGLALDPKEFAQGRAELNLAALGLDVRQEGADWGETQLEAQLARQSIGSTVSNLHLEPVEMTVPLMAREEDETTLAAAWGPLEQKIGLWTRERGNWIRRDFEAAGSFAGSVGYQILKATITPPQGWMAEHRQLIPEITLKCLRQPIAYATVEDESEEFTSEEGARELIFTLAEILGTAPGLIRIRITNRNKEGDWRGLILAGESRDYPGDETANTTAALAYDCADLTLEGGSKKAEHEGTTVVEHPELTAGWLSILNSEISGVGHMTHAGVRRPYIRAEAPEGEDIQLKMRWRVLGSTQWSENEIVLLNIVGDMQFYDLDEVRLEAPVLGEPRWEFDIQARATSGAGKVRLHRVYPLPTELWTKVETPGTAQAADLQSQKSPGTIENSTSGLSEKEAKAAVEWKEPGNAKASDGKYATAELGANAASQYLKVSNLGFVLPEDANILGILVSVERFAPSGGIAESIIKLLKGGSIVGANRALVGKKGTGQFWPEVNSYEFYGGSEDLWGESWAAAQINSSTFGVVIRAKNSSLSISHQASIDHVRVAIYYTEASDENRVCFAERSIELRTDGVFRQSPTDEIWGEVIPAGFLPVAIPYGLEGRKCRFIAIPTQSDFGSVADGGSNMAAVHAFVRPGYLFARETFG